jgi:hypothetical protein
LKGQTLNPARPSARVDLEKADNVFAKLPGT